MNTKTRWIIIWISIVLSVAITGAMIWLSLKPSDNEIYNHISYSRWIDTNAPGYDIANTNIDRFIVDINKSQLLITDAKHGTYVVDASPSIVQTLTSIKSDGTYSSTFINSLTATKGHLDIEYSNIDQVTKTSIWTYITLSISLITISLYGVYTYKGIKK